MQVLIMLVRVGIEYRTEIRAYKLWMITNAIFFMKVKLSCEIIPCVVAKTYSLDSHLAATYFYTGTQLAS